MAFANGSITFKRFFVHGQPLKLTAEALLDRLAARAMGTGSMRTADATEVGWTTGDHILDTHFDFVKNAVADGLHFALRVDTNRPPIELVRSYQKTSEDAMLEASGREFLTKAQRREAREQALARADAEARAGAFRRMKQVPVFWDLTRNQIYLGGTGSTLVDCVTLLFRETFDRSLSPATSGEMALRWAAAGGEERHLDDTRPAHFVNPPDVADLPADGMPATGEARSKDFLGTEWLTWLWYASHVESPEIATPNGGPITVLFEKSLQLECAFRITGTTAITAEAPTQLPEASVALAGGKRPIRAGLQIATPGDVFRLTIRGDVMNYTGVRLSPPEDARSSRAVFEDRIEKLRDLIDATEQMLAAFLKRRLSKKWPQTLDAVRHWVAAGRSGGRVPREPAAAS